MAEKWCIITTGTCFIHGSSLLTNTTTYCTRDQTFLASVCFISNEFLYSYLPCKVFFSMPAHSQQLTWSLIVLNCKLNQHCFSLYFNVFKKEGGGGGVPSLWISTCVQFETIFLTIDTQYTLMLVSQALKLHIILWNNDDLSLTCRISISQEGHTTACGSGCISTSVLKMQGNRNHRQMKCSLKQSYLNVSCWKWEKYITQSKPD